MATDSERIDRLEGQLAFQDDIIQQLNDALVAQQARIDALEATLQQLKEASNNDGDSAPVDEKPPHY